METGSPAMRVLIAGMALVLLRWHLWRAYLFIFPRSVRIEADSPGPTQVPGSLEATHDTLLGLGFEALGSHLEHPRLGSALLNYDYARAADGVFASVHQGLGKRPRLYFFSPTAGGGFVLTADYRRPTREVPGVYLTGALEGASADRVLNAHLRRLPELGGPAGAFTLEGRVESAKRWYATFGGRELRQQNAVGLLWTVGALGMLGAAILGRKG